MTRKQIKKEIQKMRGYVTKPGWWDGLSSLPISTETLDFALEMVDKLPPGNWHVEAYDRGTIRFREYSDALNTPVKEIEVWCGY